MITYPYLFGTTKKRPVVVLAQTDMKDIVVSKVTSADKRSKYDIVIDDWQKAGLLFQSVIRVDKLATLSQSRIIRRLGYLSDLHHMAIKNKIEQLFELS